MKAFSYTKTPYLLEQIGYTEELRKKLVLTPLSHHDMMDFKWQAILTRIQCVFSLVGVVKDRKGIEELLFPSIMSRHTTSQREMVRFKKATDELYFKWLVNPSPVAKHDLELLASQLYVQPNKLTSADLQNNLKYIQINPDNPLIQAGMAYIILLTDDQIMRDTPLLAYLLPLILLYKAGYDYRQFLVLEEYFAAHKDRFSLLIAQSVRDVNVTGWLEFVVEAAEYQLTKLLRQVSTKDFDTEKQGSTLTLTERQRVILSTLDAPGSKISNRFVQKQFKISAITAARDLSKLTNLGYLLSIGRGRSTYYTKT